MSAVAGDRTGEEERVEDMEVEDTAQEESMRPTEGGESMRE